MARTNIYIDHGFKDTHILEAFVSGASKTFILADENTAALCLPMLIRQQPILDKAIIIEIQSGEQHKIQSTLFYILENLTIHGADRKACLINLGGGVICDMGGFAAAIYKRGMQCIHIPTTLLAQIDASIGGKNGIDFLGYKNLIGLIKEPDLVYISKEFLQTLPQDEMINGLAEAFKHGLIQSKKYWDKIKINPLGHIDSLIDDSVAIKMSIVESDPNEKGSRKLLNAGHTIAHALEAWNLENYSQLAHGKAVAAGLVIESHISMQMGFLADEEFSEIRDTIFKNIGRIDLHEYHFPTLIDKMRQDKKNDLNNISFSLIRSIGKATYNDFCDEQTIINALNYYKDAG